MKSYILVLAFLFLTFNSFAQAPLKIGYVDSEVILTQFSESIKAQGDLEAFTKKLTDQRDSLQLAFQQAYADYQKQGETMASDKKAAAEQKLVNMDNDLRKWNQEKFGQGTGEIYRKQQEIMQPVLTKVKNTIEKVAKSEGLQFVFDKTQDALLIYADPAFDITFKVLDSLKRGN